MSNHSVGHSLNDYFTEEVIDLYDNQKLDYESMLKLFNAMRSVINCEDGNYEEAIECIRRSRCGKCMKKMQSGEPLYSLYSTRMCCSARMRNDYYKLEEQLVSDSLCTECFDTLVNEYEGNFDAGPTYRKYIEEHNDKEEWTAE